MTESTTKMGRVLRLTRDRGFGFIAPDSDPDGFRSGVFFHRSALVGDAFDLLQEDDRVTYVEVASAKGPRAESVSPA